MEGLRNLICSSSLGLGKQEDHPFARMVQLSNIKNMVKRHWIQSLCWQIFKQTNLLYPISMTCSGWYHTRYISVFRLFPRTSDYRHTGIVYSLRYHQLSLGSHNHQSHLFKAAVPSGKGLHSYGESRCFYKKIHYEWPKCSMAIMLNY